jgi:hypothetical protein
VLLPRGGWQLSQSVRLCTKCPYRKHLASLHDEHSLRTLCFDCPEKERACLITRRTALAATAPTVAVAAPAAATALNSLAAGTANTSAAVGAHAKPGLCLPFGQRAGLECATDTRFTRRVKSVANAEVGENPDCYDR